MINVTLGKVKTQKEKPFPKWMQTPHGYLVFFTEYGKGVCFKKPAAANDIIGLYNADWYMTDFIDCNEPVTIQNA